MLKGQLWSVSQFHDVFMHAFSEVQSQFLLEFNSHFRSHFSHSDHPTLPERDEGWLDMAKHSSYLFKAWLTLCSPP